MQKMRVAASVVGIIVALGSCAFIALNTDFFTLETLYNGSFTPGPVQVVDGYTGDDIPFESFDAFVTNNTDDYNSYWWLGNATTIQGLFDVLGSIDDSLYYTDVVVYTLGISPYGDSWDILTTGTNYIYLYVIDGCAVINTC